MKKLLVSFVLILTCIFLSGCKPKVVYKPVIYLYPTEKTDVSVQLKLNGELTCTYPEL